MPLISGVMNAVVYGPGSSGSAPGQTNNTQQPAEDPVVAPVESTPVEETNTESSTQDSGTGTSGGSSYGYSTPLYSRSDEDVIAKVMANVNGKEADDRVGAVDYARRAAIAAQAKAASSSLLDGIGSDTFSPISLMRSGGESGYARTEMTMRFGDIGDMKV